MKAPLDPQLESQPKVSDPSFAQDVLSDIEIGARGTVVNRTHRVVRQRAKVIKARRSHVRSLMLPLVVCSVLLILSAVAVWSGLYESQGTMQDVAALANWELNDEFLVVLLWFVPVSLAVVGTVWLRRAQATADHGTVR